MADERRGGKKAKSVAHDAMLTMHTSESIADLARQLVPDAHIEFVQLEGAPDRAARLADLAEERGLLDELVARVLSPARSPEQP